VAGNRKDAMLLLIRESLESIENRERLEDNNRSVIVVVTLHSCRKAILHSKVHGFFRSKLNTYEAVSDKVSI
jgi:hypothetical protein